MREGLGEPGGVVHLETRLAGLPAGVTVGPRRIEVRFDSAEEALVQLVALAQALTNDLGQFQRLVARGSRGGPAREKEEIWWTETERRG